jgi:hypothetical protein
MPWRGFAREEGFASRQQKGQSSIMPGLHTACQIWGDSGVARRLHQPAGLRRPLAKEKMALARICRASASQTSLSFERDGDWLRWKTD